MLTQQQFPQLSFNLNNPDAPNTIYLTDDPTVNKLSLVITTNTDNSVFNPGTLVAPGQASGGSGTLLYLDLTALGLTGDQLNDLVPVAENWVFQPYASANSQVVGMTPTTPVTLDSGTGNTITIQVNKLVLTQPPASGSASLTCSAYRVDNITLGNLALITNFKVLLQEPPSGKADLHQAIQVSVSQAMVVNTIAGYTPVKNSLSLVFGPGINPKTVKATDHSRFTLTFVYATESPGYGALTTPAAALDFSVQPGINASQWSITTGSQQQNPSWLLKPPANKPILGTGSQATLQFDIGNMVTILQPGPTLLLLSYTGIPGYQDGSYAVLLQKIPHVDIRSLTVTPNPSVLTAGHASVTLAWQVYDAGTMVLMPGYHDVTGQNQLTVSIDDSTVFSLNASGSQMSGAGNIAMRNVTARVLPVINNFSAEPAVIYRKDFPKMCTISWDVNIGAGSMVQLYSSATGPDPNYYGPTGSVTKGITKPQLLTVSPVERNNALLAKNLIIAGFAIQTAHYPTPAAANFVAASPQAGFLVASLTGQNQLAFLNTLTFQNTATVQVGKSPLGLAFSPDGSLLSVANSGDGTVSLLQGSPGGWNVTATVTVGGNPQQVAFSPDGQFLYVTVDNGTSQNGSLVVLKRQGNGQYASGSTLTMGIAPRGLGLLPSGAQIFVANMGSDSLSVVGVSSGGVHTLLPPMSNLPDQPTGLAVSRDGVWLLVACSGVNQVVGINTMTQSSPGFSLAVGNKPRWITTIPNSTYALVSNSSDNTVSLISYDGKGAVLENAMAVGGSPMGVAVTPDSGLALVANPGNSTLSVLTLGQYQEVTTPVPLPGNQPTDLLVVPPGDRVLVWHNGNLSFSGASQPAATGFFVYESASQSVTQQMAGSKIIQMVCAPDGTRGYLTQSQQTGILCIDLETFQPVETLPLLNKPNLPNRYPLNLALSTDSSRLFALVANGNRNYSVVVFELDPATHDWTLVADLVVFTTTYTSSVLLLCASPDGSAAYAVDSVDKQLWQIKADQSGAYQVVTAPVTLGNAPSSMAISPDGSRVYTLNTGGMTNSISMVAVSTLQVTTTPLPAPIMSAALNRITLSPDGTRIYATDGACVGIRVMDAATLRFIQTLSWQSTVTMPYGIAIRSDGSTLYTANVMSNDMGLIQQVQPA